MAFKVSEIKGVDKESDLGVIAKKQEETRLKYKEQYKFSEKETQIIVDDFEENPTPQKSLNVITAVENDKNLSRKDKDLYIKDIESKIVELFSFKDYKNDNLEKIETDIVSLQKLQILSTYLIGDRLIYLHDEFDVQNGKLSKRLKEYGSFYTYAQEKFKISKTSTSFYMNIAKYIKPVHARKQVEPSKIRPYLPIFRKIEESEESDKEVMLNDMIAESINVAMQFPFREVVEKAKKKMVELGYAKNIDSKNHLFLDKKINDFYKLIPNELSNEEKTSIRYFIVKLQNMLDK